MKIYQLNNVEGESLGLIQTDAPYKEVEQVWENIYREDIEDEDYIELVEKVCNHLGEHWEVERIFLEEVNP